MFSLRNLLRKEDNLLTLLEASALQARTSIQALITACHDKNASVAVQDLAYSRLKDRKITKEINDSIYSTFIAVLDHEDMERLSSALYKIPKMIEKFSDRLRSSPEIVRAVDFSGQLAFLDQATDVLVQLVGTLQHGFDLKKVKTLNDKLHAIERGADEHMLKLYKDLYSGKYEAVQVVALKDLYELLEKTVDRCRTAGNVIGRLALKNS